MKKVLRKRYIRNILMITMIVVLTACSCLTYGYAKEQAQSNAIENIQSQFGEMPSGQMPQFDGSSQDGAQAESGNTNDNQQQAPPDMQNGEMPSDFDGSTPPDMNGAPDDNSDNASGGSAATESANGPSRSENGPSKSGNSQSGDNSGRPQRPDSGNAESATEDEQAAQSNDGSAEEDTTKSANGPSRSNNGQMPGGDNQNMSPSDFSGNAQSFSGGASAQISAPFIALLALENALAATIFVYLLLSGFNKRGFRKTLKNTKNVIILVLAVILLAGTVTLGQFACTGRTEIPFNAPSTSQQQILPDSQQGEEQTTEEQTTEADSTKPAGNEASVEISI